MSSSPNPQQLCLSWENPLFPLPVGFEKDFFFPVGDDEITFVHQTFQVHSRSSLSLMPNPNVTENIVSGVLWLLKALEHKQQRRWSLFSSALNMSMKGSVAYSAVVVRLQQCYQIRFLVSAGMSAF